MRDKRKLLHLDRLRLLLYFLYMYQLATAELHDDAVQLIIRAANRIKEKLD